MVLDAMGGAGGKMSVDLTLDFRPGLCCGGGGCSGKCRNSSVEAGVPKVLFELEQPLPSLSQFDVTADGQRFIMAIPAEEDANPPIIIVTNWQEALVKQ